MKVLSKRLTKAEAVLRPPPGCAVCRRWDGTVVGDETGKRSRPEVCQEGGWVERVRMLAIVAGIDLDWL